MKNIVRSIFLLSLISITSCEDNGMIVNCQECATEEPVNAEIEIKLDIQTYGDPVIINVYDGNIEEGVINSTHTAGGNRITIVLRINKRYTFSAIYSTPTGSYTVIDSALPRVAYNKDQCDDPCFYVYDKVVNLRLKYTK
jgi:hypothetical protein